MYLSTAGDSRKLHTTHRAFPHSRARAYTQRNRAAGHHRRTRRELPVLSSRREGRDPQSADYGDGSDGQGQGPRGLPDASARRAHLSARPANSRGRF